MHAMHNLTCSKTNQQLARQPRVSCSTRAPLRLQAAGSTTAVSAKTRKRTKASDQAFASRGVNRNPKYLADLSNQDDLYSDTNTDSAANRVETFSSNNYRALVLDLAYRPINVVSWLKALKMDMLGRAEVLEYYSDCCVVSAYKTFQMPAVMRVHVLMDMSTVHGRVSLTRRNIMLRDKNTCQYCGVKNLLQKQMTIDHVIPVSLGGNNTWENLVTACKPCNQRKGSSQLKQLGWRLRIPLREPTMYDLGMVARGIHPSEVECPPLEWRGYIHFRKRKNSSPMEKALKNKSKSVALAPSEA